MLPMNIRSSAELPLRSNDMASNWSPAGMPFSYLGDFGLADEHLQQIALLLERYGDAVDRRVVRESRD